MPASDPPLAEYLAERRARVDAALARVLGAVRGCPEALAAAMRYSVLAGGKRFRPILTLAAAESAAARTAGRDVDIEIVLAAALPAACALELIHTYSLVHDDLPAMDNDTLRRGRPTAHVVWGDGLAILSGDALLTEAFALLAREPGGNDPRLADRKLRTIGVVAAAAGAAGMVGGQVIDLQAAGQVGGTAGVAREMLDGDGLRRMDGMKTGALIRAAAVAGAIMGGGTEGTIRAVDAYAAELGLAFQIVDDILDVEGTTAELGKTAGKDVAAGKPTYVAMHGPDGARRLAAACLERARAALTGAGLKSGRLEEIAAWVVERSS